MSLPSTINSYERKSINSCVYKFPNDLDFFHCFVFLFRVRFVLLGTMSMRSFLTNSKHAVDLHHSLTETLTSLYLIYSLSHIKNSTHHQFKLSWLTYGCIECSITIQLCMCMEMESNMYHFFLTNNWHPSKSSYRSIFWGSIAIPATLIVCSFALLYYIFIYSWMTWIYMMLWLWGEFC